MKYNTNILHKNNVCYCSDQGVEVYVTYQDNIDNTYSECLQEKDEFLQRLNSKKENESFIIREKDLKNMNINTSKYHQYQIGKTILLY